MKISALEEYGLRCLVQLARAGAEPEGTASLSARQIAEREGLKATEADIDDRVAETATKRGANPSEIYAALQKAGRIPEIERSITEEKVFAFLMEKNTVANG